jgi:hypothetical protein
MLQHSVYDEPEAASVHAHYDRLVDTVAERLPAVAAHRTQPARECWPSQPSRRRPEVIQPAHTV